MYGTPTMFINRGLFIFTHSAYESGSEFRSGLLVNQTEKNHILFGTINLEFFYSVKHLEHYFISYFEYMRKNLTAPKQD